MTNITDYYHKLLEGLKVPPHIDCVVHRPTSLETGPILFKGTPFMCAVYIRYLQKILPMISTQFEVTPYAVYLGRNPYMVDKELDRNKRAEEMLNKIREKSEGHRITNNFNTVEYTSQAPAKPAEVAEPEDILALIRKRQKG